MAPAPAVSGQVVVAGAVAALALLLALGYFKSTTPLSPLNPDR